MFRLQHFYPKHVSAQARQDIRINAKLGGRAFFQSGQLTYNTALSPPVQIVSSSRPAGIPGYPFASAIANATSTGVHDNFPPINSESYGLAFEDEEVTFDLINQSDVYAHVVGICFSGYIFPVKGQNKCEVYRSVLSS
jgi:hypothetical protein